MNYKNFIPWIKEKLFEYKRVIIISKKPTSKEVWDTSKIALAGTLIIGTLGFIIQMLFYLFGVR